MFDLSDLERVQVRQEAELAALTAEYVQIEDQFYNITLCADDSMLESKSAHT